MQIINLKDVKHREEVLIFNLVNKEWFLARWDNKEKIFHPDDGMSFRTTDQDLIFRLPNSSELGQMLVDFIQQKQVKEI